MSNESNLAQVYPATAAARDAQNPSPSKVVSHLGDLPTEIPDGSKEQEEFFFKEPHQDHVGQILAQDGFPDNFEVKEQTGAVYLNNERNEALDGLLNMFSEYSIIKITSEFLTKIVDDARPKLANAAKALSDKFASNREALTEAFKNFSVNPSLKTDFEELVALATR